MILGTSWAPPPDTRLGEAPKDGNEMGKDAFMKLLVAQLGNQDPTSPMESSAFVAQLAQFSSVELLQGMGGRLDQLLVATAASNQANVVQFVGKDVQFLTDKVSLSDGPVRFDARFPRAAADVTVTITDENGETVRTLHPGSFEAGSHSIEWDGLDEKGNPCGPGSYKVKVTAKDESGAAIEVTQSLRGRVDGVTYENGYPELLVGSLTISLADVVEIHAASLPKEPQ